MDILDSLRSSLEDITHITADIAARGPESCEKDLYGRLVGYDLSHLYCNSSLCLLWVANQGPNLAESAISSGFEARNIAMRLLSDFLVRIVRIFVDGKCLVRQKRKPTGVAYSRPTMINGLRENERLMIGKRRYGVERLLNMMYQLLQQMNTLLKSHYEDEKVATCLSGASSYLLDFAVDFESLLGDLFEKEMSWLSLQVDELGEQGSAFPAIRSSTS